MVISIFKKVFAVVLQLENELYFLHCHIISCSNLAYVCFGGLFCFGGRVSLCSPGYHKPHMYTRLAWNWDPASASQVLN